MLFLAGGLAFNVLLALVPFALLLISGIALLLGRGPEQATATVTGLLESFLPNDAPTANALLGELVRDVLRTRGAVSLYAAIGFAWFSTRLFGSLRSVLAQIFDGTDRSIVVGKLFDFLATFVATVAVVVYIAMSAYLDLATTQGVQFLMRLGLRESAMGMIAYVGGRLVAISVVFALFYSLYHGLPRKRPTARTALVAATAASLLFEVARHVFSILVRHFDPSSLYTGTIAAVVAVVFWTYYSSLIFLLGGELAQAYELRRAEVRALRRQEASDAAAAASALRPVRPARPAPGRPPTRRNG